MIMEELVKRDWFLSNLDVDNGWQGSKIIVPFKGAGASSVEFGQLADIADISQSTYVRGSIDNYVESWASLIFNHRDLMDSEGKIPEATFLKILPGEVDAMVDYFKQVVSTSLGAGSHFARFMTNGTVSGTFETDHIDRFQIGQKLQIDDNDSSPLTVYVTAINVNAVTVTGSTGTVTVSTARTGGPVTDISTYTTAQSARCFHPGVLTNGSFTSIREVLLSAANGGSATVHGVSKLLYPVLQATNLNGGSGTLQITATNILEKLFEGYTVVRSKAKGNANTIVMSFKHLGNVMKAIETQKGPYSVTTRRYR